MGCWSTHVTLLMLLIGTSSAGPDAVSRSNCEDQNVLHSRMEAVEKRLEDTVQTLETELAVLLDAIEAPEWRPLLGPDSSAPLIDIQEGRVMQSRTEHDEQMKTLQQMQSTSHDVLLTTAG